MIVVAVGFLLGFAASWPPIAVVGTGLLDSSLALTNAAGGALGHLLTLIPLPLPARMLLLAWLLATLPAFMAALILGLVRAETSLRTLLVIIVAGLVGYAVYREGLSPVTLGLVVAAALAGIVAIFAARFVGFVLGIFTGALCVTGAKNALDGSVDFVSWTFDVATGISWGVLGDLLAYLAVGLPYVVVLTMLIRPRQ